ncbi:hypothetical protein Tco_0579068 [Tanacetum coccineum]
MASMISHGWLKEDISIKRVDVKDARINGMEVEDETETAITLIHLFILWTTEDDYDQAVSCISFIEAKHRLEGFFHVRKGLDFSRSQSKKKSLGERLALMNSESKKSRSLSFEVVSIGDADLKQTETTFKSQDRICFRFEKQWERRFGLEKNSKKSYYAILQYKAEYIASSEATMEAV